MPLPCPVLIGVWLLTALQYCLQLLLLLLLLSLLMLLLRMC